MTTVCSQTRCKFVPLLYYGLMAHLQALQQSFTSSLQDALDFALVAKWM